ncbi:hypothetical protein GFB49_08950 [Epibacterium sp. SM1979]|uniref:Uncharacterized protein n=1 Tax=Tritonibacter litoralis TaxID=2662264 RepID=A0A843YIL0_9RHOB|nr:DUF6478 family protein [Tritonibacter litoralis]MQQ08577.1 hypothetical protein [Tritonibacter litoralis]
MGQLLDRVMQRHAWRFWRKAARDAANTPLSTLRGQLNQARHLRQHLDQIVHVAEGRLALPQIGSSAFPKPHGTDWSWRPELWRGPLATPGLSSVQTKARLGHEVQMFHDCAESEISLRQLRNSRESDLAPFGLRMDVFKFDGSFLSLVVDLPADAARGLSKHHLIRVNSLVESEEPIEIFARLNIQHGPNTEQLVRELSSSQKDQMVEFDLAYSRLNEKRIEKLWLDLIFEAPDLNQVVLRDLTLLRLPRAAL